MSLGNERQTPTQDLKIQAKLPYFLMEVEFVNILVTGYVGICLEPACSSNVVILGMDMEEIFSLSAHCYCPWRGQTFPPLLFTKPRLKQQTLGIVVVRALKFL